MVQLTPIYITNGQLEAESIRLFLESFGINAIISQESAGLSIGLTIGPLGQAIIMVPENQAEEASDLLNKMEEGDTEE